ncbi:hypothetical protein K488DRAFT_19827, partial [Vararia minispora EC-137]
SSEHSQVEVPRSPSLRRWDTLRRHVLSRDTASFDEPPLTPPLPVLTPNRPATPTRGTALGAKQFRLPKRFRQVVEQAQEVSGDNTRRFADDVIRAVLVARTGEQKNVKRHEREGTTPFNMTFMSTNITLPGTASSSATNVAQGRFAYIGGRGACSPIPTVQYGPSIDPLHSLLTQYSVTQADAMLSRETLPHETDVLSVLLSPFLNPVVSPTTELARLQSLETFEALVKTWPSSSNEVELQRCFWCCKAAQSASVPKMVRGRLLGALSTGLFAPSSSFRASAPTTLRTLLQALFSLLASLSSLDDSWEEVDSVRELITGALHGGCGDLDPEIVLQELGVRMAQPEDIYVKGCIVVQALSACLELDAPANRPHIIEALSEDFWRLDANAGVPPAGLTPLFSRTLARCSRAILDYIPLSDHPTEYPMSTHVYRLFRERLVVQAETLPDSDAAEPRSLIARIALRMLCMDDTSEQEEAKVLLAQSFSLSKSPWTAAFESALRQMTEEEPWSSLIVVLTALIEQLPDDFRVPVTAAFLPHFNERLANDPPPHPSPALTELLSVIVQNHPKLFYKPLFALAGASKDTTIVANLRIVVQSARFLSDYWTRDVEMMLVALMSDGTSGAARRARPGQLVLTLELIAHVRTVARARKDQVAPSWPFAAQARFLFALDNRLGAVLAATDTSSPLPSAQRVVLVTLFLEIRLFIRSLKSAQWLPRVLAWVTVDSGVAEDDNAADAVATRLATVYTEAQTWRGTLHKYRATIAPPISSTPQTFRVTAVNGGGPYDHLSDRISLLDGLRSGLLSNALALLVACSGLLSSDDYRQLNGTLWNECLDRAAPPVQFRAAFLLMQAAERPETGLLELIRADLVSPHAEARRGVAKRLGLLAGWRLQLLTQPYITDKNYRRPFKLTRGPLSFVATDMGASTWVLEDDIETLKASNGTAIPVELRKRLADIGWTLDIEAVDRRAELIKAPMALLPSQHLDRMDSAADAVPLTRPPSPRPDTDGALASDTRQPAVKRRPIFVPALAGILSELAYLLFDDDFTVVGAARSTLLDLMREDPALVSRPVLDLYASGDERIQEGITVLQAFVHMQRVLPPAMSHYVYNHVTGYLKTTAKRPDASFTAFAYSLPVLASLTAQVSSLSVRDIRRSKVEPFLVPSGTLWFPPSAPTGSMFPRSLGDAMQSGGSTVKERLVQMTMIRVAQNMLFLNMLRRHPQDVTAIRKNMTRLVLPSLNEPFDFNTPDMHAYIPKKPGTNGAKLKTDSDIAGMSLVLSRSYLLLIETVFRSMPRHLGDRNELAVLIDGLNKILLAHGDDIGIVAHVMIALTVASARFRRLFSSSGGYTLFMPAVLKVYAEMEDNAGIRAAIEYAVNRFYALYQESFVFQSLDVLAHIMTYPNVDCEWMAKQVHALFHSLKDSSPLSAPDHAGIHGANMADEQEALLIYTAEEKPQALFSILKREKSSRGGEHIDLVIPEQYEGRKLTTDNMVRLFLTVIGHDPGIRRAEYFLHLLRYMTPWLYSDRQSHQVLKGGIEAFSTIFIARSSGNNRKVPENAQLRPQDDSSFTVYSQAGGDFFGERRAPSDLVAMRLDFLSLVVAFTRAGGHLDSSSAASSRVMDLVKIVLKDGENDRSVVNRMSTFLAEYTHSALVRSTPLKIKHVLAFLRDLFPVYKAYAVVVDFSGVLSALLELSQNRGYAQDPSFTQMVIGQYCAIALEACELASSSHDTFPLRPILVKLLCHAMLMKGVDPVSIIEKQPMTYGFVADILLPLVLDLPSTREVSRKTEWSRGAPARTMARLLLMVMSQCESAQSQGGPSHPARLERSNSKDKRADCVSKSTSVALLSMFVQIIKIIVLRAEDDLSLAIPGIWVQLGQFFKRILADGGAQFALQTFDGESEISRPPSPLSPRHRSSMDDPSNPFAPTSRSNSLSTQVFVRPRVVDYLFWSTLEFACLHRSPLLVQLRLAMQTAAARVDIELRTQTAPSPRTRRLSVFAKPRRRSGQFSGGTTPEASPFLRASQPNKRQPGYARFPSPLSSPSLAPAGPRIVHLGPVQSSPIGSGGGLFRRGSGHEEVGDSELPAHVMAARTTHVSSAILVRATYRRVRVVQQVMGYTLLLPLVEGEGEDAIGDVQTWTRRQALEAVKQEVEELRGEFSSSALEDEGVLVDAD